MGTALAQVRFARVGGLPQDIVINTFHFETQGAEVTDTEADTIITKLIAFYVNSPGAGQTAPQGYMSNAIALSGHEVRVYDLGDVEPRVPVRSETFSLTLVQTNACPSEVALCISYSGDIVSGVPAARRRGRIFFGPLSTGTLQTVAGGEVRPTALVQSHLANAAFNLATAAGPVWVVRSEVGTLMNTPIRNIWVDNAFDTQRRRGADPTSRVTRTLNV